MKEKVAIAAGTSLSLVLGVFALLAGCTPEQNQKVQDRVTAVKDGVRAGCQFEIDTAPVSAMIAAADATGTAMTAQAIATTVCTAYVTATKEKAAVPALAQGLMSASCPNGEAFGVCIVGKPE